MSQVVVRGETIYECSVCARKTRVPTNRYSLDVMQRCNITQHCKGSLHKVTLVREINSTPAFPPEVAGIQDWFQRKILYTHQQSIESKVWIIEHNLGTKPVIHAYVHTLVGDTVELVEQDPALIEIIDLNNIRLTFARPSSGLVQAVALTSANEVNPDALKPVVAIAGELQMSTDVGEVAIATLDGSATITLDVTFITGTNIPNVDVHYEDIDNTTSVSSPWTSVRKVVVNGRRYTVRSFNIATQPNAFVSFNAGLVPSGSALIVKKINNVDIKQHDVLFLSAKTPFTYVDRIYDRYVDPVLLTPTDPELYWENGKVFCKPKGIKQVYPAIYVV